MAKTLPDGSARELGEQFGRQRDETELENASLRAEIERLKRPRLCGCCEMQSRTATGAHGDGENCACYYKGQGAAVEKYEVLLDNGVNENMRLMTLCAERQDEIKARGAEIESLRAERDRLLATIQGAEIDRKALLEEIASLRARLEAALKSLYESRRAMFSGEDRTAQDIAHLNKELECRDLLIKDHLTKIMHLENRVEEEFAHREALERDLAAARESAAAFQKNFDAEKAENERLRARLEAAEQATLEEIDHRDAAQDALAETHVALGGNGEWVGRIPEQEPPDSGDLHRDVPALAEIVKRERDGATKECDRLMDLLKRADTPAVGLLAMSRLEGLEREVAAAREEIKRLQDKYEMHPYDPRRSEADRG